MKLFRWSVAPDGVTPVQRENFRNVQVDAIGIGLANAASPFLPVFLTRLDASNLQVGLITSMPALTGFFFAILAGRFLQKQRNVVPWFSLSRLLVVSSYALTGLAPFLVPRSSLIQVVLLIWAMATLPQTVLNISFSVVMNAVAGPKGRYELMSRRWSILGLTTAVTVAAAGLVLDRLRFPLNYQLVFLALSLGGLLSYYYSSHIELPDVEPRASGAVALPLRERMRGVMAFVRAHPAFVSFVSKRFVYATGAVLTIPLFPLYYVRVVQASDSWIGLIHTAQTATTLLGYVLWAKLSRSRGSQFALLCTVFAMGLYPALVGVTRRVEWILVLASLAGIFQAGVDLVFFDELMRTIPAEYSATFVALAASLQYLSTILGPFLGTWLADGVGIPVALIAGAVLRLAGFALFARKSGVAGQAMA
jgi:hypothetical protein